MPYFKVLLIKEHVHKNVDKVDTKMCILYDETEDQYFYYGTRNDTNQSSYVNFNGSYHYTQLGEMMSFISYLMNNFYQVITTELHAVYIDSDEYDNLSYKKLVSKMRNATLLSAYDKKKESKKSLKQYISFL